MRAITEQQEVGQWAVWHPLKDVDRPKALLGREMPAEARHAPLPQVHRITKWKRVHGPRAVRGAGGGGLHLNLGARMGTVSLIIPFPTVPSAA